MVTNLALPAANLALPAEGLMARQNARKQR